MWQMMIGRKLSLWGLLANISNELPQLDELENVAKPGMLRRYLEDLVPDLKNFVLRIVIAVLIYVVGRRLIKWLRKVLHNAMVRSSMGRAASISAITASNRDSVPRSSWTYACEPSATASTRGTLACIPDSILERYTNASFSRISSPQVPTRVADSPDILK